ATGAAFPGVASLEGDAASRISDGAKALAILAGLCVAAGLLSARHALRTRADADQPPARTRRLGPVPAAIPIDVLTGLGSGGAGGPSRAAARPRRGGRTVRRRARLVPARVDRLGLAAPGGLAAGARAGGRAGRALGAARGAPPRASPRPRAERIEAPTRRQRA